MTLEDDHVDLVHKVADSKVASAAAFRATVTAVSGTMVSIQRDGEATGSDELYVTVTRFLLAVDDVVLCVPLGPAGTPVIIDVLETDDTNPATGTLTAPTIVDFTHMQHDHLDVDDGGVLTGYQQKDTGYFTPPGPGVVDATTVTNLASGQTGARYLGMAAEDLTNETVKVTVTTAGSTITWSEAALASANSSVGGNLTLLGSVTSLNAIVNSTGVKTLTFAVPVPAGTFVFLLLGAQASVVPQYRATLADELSSGVVRLATTQPSTMGAAKPFSTSTAVTGAIAAIAQWS